MENMKVRDVMAHGVPTCSPFARLREVEKIMATEKKPFLIVTDEMGEMWGIITEMIVLKYLGEDLTAEDIMASPVITILPTVPIKEALKIMLQKGIHHLIVEHATPEQPSRPVGYISSSHIIQAASQQKE